MISIVIPALNEEKFIGRCLESLKNQDFKDTYEIIVVDNGSTDSTAKIAGEMGARVVICPQKGVSYARQAGAQAALGEIIVQTDADTIYPRWWLARIQKQFTSHKVPLASPYFLFQNPLVELLSTSLSPLIFCQSGPGRPYIISSANFAF
jgi:glycosyltransferase involved in cell wall biosynthesis